MSSHSAPRPRFTSLPATECLALVGSHAIGRVGWNSIDGLQILPVTYVVSEGMIAFRTSPYGALAELRNVMQVAFEVDEFDEATRTGWSVLVRGTSRAAVDSDQLVRLWQHDEPVPWATGDRNLFITISQDHLSGRVISS